MVSLVGIGLLVAAFAIDPDAREPGPRSRLAPPPCGFKVSTGYPCPTCGMTTAFGRGVRGQWIAAVRAQPTGFLLFLCVVVVTGAALYGVLTGRSWQINWWRIPPWRAIWLLVCLLAAGWAIKIAEVAVTDSPPAQSAHSTGSDPGPTAEPTG